LLSCLVAVIEDQIAMEKVWKTDKRYEVLALKSNEQVEIRVATLFVSARSFRRLLRCRFCISLKFENGARWDGGRNKNGGEEGI
jgi:hypothetical protein